MNAARLLFIAAGLMLLAAGLFAFAGWWLYAALLLAGTLGCGAAAWNFRNQKKEEEKS